MTTRSLTRRVQLARMRMAGLVALCCIGMAHGQSPDQAPAMAFGGGRMVRGTVTAVAPDHLTVKTEAGDIFTVSVTPNTQVRHGREPMKLADVHAGDGVGAMGEIDRPNKTVHALMLTVITAEQIKKAKEDMGKTYITGKVTAMDDVKLTILRSDGVTQVIQVDEGTSFKRGGRGMAMAFGGGMGGFGGGEGRPAPAEGAAPRAAGSGANAGAGSASNAGESITLADIKVGDIVGGQGALKNGVFVPTELNVADPAARGQRRRQGEGSDAAAQPKSMPPSQ